MAITVRTQPETRQSLQPPPASGRPTALPLILFAMTLAIAGLLPSPARGLLALPLGGGVAVLSCSVLARERGLTSQLDIGLGLIVCLALTSVLQLLALAVGIKSSYAASAVLLIIISAPALITLPVATLTSFKRQRNAVSWLSVGGWTAAGVAAVAGGSTVGWSMIIARAHPGGSAAFAVFWVGVLAMLMPSLFLAARGVKQGQNMVVVVLGLATYWPTIVRSPWAPNLHDEFAHWGEAQQMLRTNELFQPDSVLPIGAKYPGLQTITVAVARLTGWSTISAGHAMIAAMHVATLMGIVTIYRLMTRETGRYGVLAAGIYAVSPSFLHIDTLFSYESFAIPLALWLLVAITRAASPQSMETQGTRPTQASWAGIAALCAGCLVVTHHLTTFVVAAVLALVAACCWGSAVRSRRRRQVTAEGLEIVVHVIDFRPAVFAIAAVLVGAAGAWWALALHAPLIDYLGRFPRAALSGAWKLLTGHTSTDAAIPAASLGQVRQVFGGSSLPGYERALSVIAQLLLAAAYTAGVVRRRAPKSGLRMAMIVLGALYFASLPFTLITGASAGAHRSWAITFIGLAIIIANAFEAKGDRDTPTTPRIYVTLTAGLIAVLVGSYAAAVNVFERFPGSYAFSVDGRTTNADMTRSATWFAANEGYGKSILTDIVTRTVFGSYAATVDRPFPEWDLFFPTTAPSTAATKAFLASGIDYIVVNTDLSREAPRQYYFASFEPPAPAYPLPTSSIEKFDSMNWVSAVHRDGSIVIYKVNH